MHVETTYQAGSEAAKWTVGLAPASLFVLTLPNVFAFQPFFGDEARHKLLLQGYS